ncbi:MAG: NAD(P)-dependent oxidoreductase, partial [Bacteroidales bacterium]|nr:NAD(P)-dependent oxidoreductase [Bacteroidales bacterium]
MKKILITGANGFIGSHLVEAALSKGWEVWAGIRSTSDLRYLPLDKMHRIELDLSDAVRLNVQIAAHIRDNGSWDYIVHAAGRTKAVRRSDFLGSNTQATAHLLNALKQGSCEKLLYVSSFAAFGQGLRTEYGRSKRSAEVLVLGQSDIPSVVVRPVGVYGPRDTDFFQQIRLLKSGW